MRATQILTDHKEDTWIPHDRGARSSLGGRTATTDSVPYIPHDGPHGITARALARAWRWASSANGLAGIVGNIEFLFPSRESTSGVVYIGTYVPPSFWSTAPSFWSQPQQQRKQPASGKKSLRPRGVSPWSEAV